MYSKCGSGLAREGDLTVSAFPACAATAQTTPRYPHSPTSNPPSSAHPERPPPDQTFPAANAVTFTPPTNGEIFKGMMEEYRHRYD